MGVVINSTRQPIDSRKK